ncbi:PREDICTED: olfactory receptor 14A16-like, partial [Tauraco erythrolophus]|uniref:olfactory receptor 14A16-like n=1 Tax=Tauraco erythrolophus TaxID=121530 RepID=UPI00052349E2
TRELQLLHFWVLLGIYLAALLANGLIIITVACDHHLHTPMYFFLLSLSLLDLGSISTTVPKNMANFLWDTRDISYAGCTAQVLLLFLLLWSRICSSHCHVCHGNALDQFFCEIPQILKLSCSHSYLREVGLLLVGACLAFGCFMFIVVSYVQIFRAVLRIPSEQGRHKAFSTCLPHLAVVSLFLSTAIFAHLKPPSISSPVLDLVVAGLYSVVPPVVNPLIYSMRNQELKDALRKLMGQCLKIALFHQCCFQENVQGIGLLN